MWKILDENWLTMLYSIIKSPAAPPSSEGWPTAAKGELTNQVWKTVHSHHKARWMNKMENTFGVGSFGEAHLVHFEVRVGIWRFCMWLRSDLGFQVNCFPNPSLLSSYLWNTSWGNFVCLYCSWTKARNLLGELYLFVNVWSNCGPANAQILGISVFWLWKWERGHQ